VSRSLNQLCWTVDVTRWYRLLVLALVPAMSEAQIVRGVILDSLEKDPIQDAWVSLLDSTGHLISAVRSARNGRFRLDARGNRYFAVHTRSAGFQALVSGWIEGALTDVFDVTVRLPRLPGQLPEIVVTAERDSLREFATILGMKVGTFGGRLITPSQVAYAVGGARDYLDVLQSQAIVGFSLKCLDRSCVERCYASNRGGCVKLYIDDVPVRLENAADLIPPWMIDYALVLRSGEAGVFAGGDSQAGALLIYTKGRLRLRRGAPRNI
jgi:hypothetical protein